MEVRINCKPALTIEKLVPASDKFPYWTFYYIDPYGVNQCTFRSMNDIKTLTISEDDDVSANIKRSDVPPAEPQ